MISSDILTTMEAQVPTPTIKFSDNLKAFSNTRRLEVLLLVLVLAATAFVYLVQDKTDTLEEIKDSGVLRVLMSDDPDTQFQLNSDRYGFEYEMLKSYADSIGVKLDIKIVPYGKLFNALNHGEANIAAGGILLTPLVGRLTAPTESWFSERLTVVYRRGTDRPRKPQEIAGIPVYASARFYSLAADDELIINDNYRSEYALLSAVSNGDIRFALSTNNRARSAKYYLPDLNRAFTVPGTAKLVWALPKRHDVELLEDLNRFITQKTTQKLAQRLSQQYFSRERELNTYEMISIHEAIDSKLPEFENEFRKAARIADIDWYLLAAVAYQESQWSNAAVSPTGVRGIMQLTQETAKFLGVSDRLNVDESIRGAARYIAFLKDSLPEQIEQPDRTWFALAAYNMGLKHILAAYRQARSKGKNPLLWNQVSPELTRLYGGYYPRGYQAQIYVRRIKIFTDIMRFYDTHQSGRNSQRIINIRHQGPTLNEPKDSEKSADKSSQESA